MNLRTILPTDWIGYALSLLLVVFQAGWYVWRVNEDEFIMDAGLGLFFMLLGLAPLLLLGFAVVALTVGAALWYSLRRNGRALPLVVLAFGGVLALAAPLPPSPAETAFYRSRAGYEAVVRLAANRQLGHESDGRESTCGYAYALPEEYRALADACVVVEYQPELAVSFHPPASHRAIVYAASREALKELGDCYEFGAVFKQLEDHWYICTPAQD